MLRRDLICWTKRNKKHVKPYPARKPPGATKMQEHTDIVTDLTNYRQQKNPNKESEQDEKSNFDDLIHEIAYHLLKAIQAVKKLPH